MARKIIKPFEPLDLDQHLVGEKPKNRVAKIGVELEGAWKVLPPGIEGLEKDTSVFGDPPGSGKQTPPLG